MTDPGGERARRALAWMAIAALAMTAAGFVYLRPSLNAPPARSTGGSAAPRQLDPTFINVTFGDADHGAVQVFTPGRAYPVAPIYLTSDGGRTWKRLAWKTNDLAAVTFLEPRRMLAERLAHGTVDLWVSEDGGRTWKPLGVGPTQVNVIGAWPVFVGRDGWWLDVRPQVSASQVPQVEGLWHTSDGGGTWARLKASGFPSTSYTGQLQFVDARHGALITGVASKGFTVVASSDGGQTWQPAATFDTPVPGSFTWGISLLRHGSRLLFWMAVSALDPRSPVNSLEALTLDSFTSVSDDGGATWGPLRPGPVTTSSPAAERAVIDENGRLLLLDGRRLWTSDDGGATWVPRMAVVPAGLTPELMEAAVPGSIFVMAARTTAALRTTGPWPTTLLRSTDGGVHWAEVRLPHP